MTEHFQLLELHDDAALIAEYERHHAPSLAWPEITAPFRRSGIKEMRIYRLGTRLMMVMQVDETFSFTAKAADRQFTAEAPSRAPRRLRRTTWRRNR